MNRALAEAVLKVIDNASSEDSARLRSFSLRQWRQNHHWLITSGLALHLLDTLRKSDAESVLPDRYRDRLAELNDASAVRTDELRRDLLDLNRRFQSLGLPYVNWKGFALAPEFCADIRLRNQTDYDFIIRPDDADCFHRALRDAGYVRFEKLENEWRYDLFPGEQYSLEDVYRPKPHRRVELHLGMDSAPATAQAMDFAQVLQRRQIRDVSGIGFPVLAPEDAFVAHAAHAGKHALTGWVRIAWLLELVTFARRHADDRPFWQRVVNRLDATSRFNVRLGLALASRAWPRSAPGVLSLVSDILPPNLVFWLDQNGRRFALSDFPGTKLHLFFLRELLDKSAFDELERSALFPVKAPAKVAFAPTMAPFSQRARAARHQARFVLKRVKFHLIENARYLLMKRQWLRSKAQSPANAACNQRDKLVSM